MSNHGGDRFVLRHKRAPAPQAVAPAADATTAVVGAAQPVTLDTATVPAAATRAEDVTPTAWANRSQSTATDPLVAATTTPVAADPVAATTTATPAAAATTTTTRAPARVTTTTTTTPATARVATSPAAASSSSTTNTPAANPRASSSASSSARNASSSAGASAGSGANNASSAKSSSDSSSGISGGAIAGIVIAILVVAGVGAGYLFWRRKRRNNLRSSALGHDSWGPTMGGAAAAAAAGAAAGYGATSAGGAGPYRKQHETGDSEELFAHSSASPNSWGGVNQHAAAQQQLYHEKGDDDVYGHASPYGGSTVTPAMAAVHDPWNGPSQQQQQEPHPLYPPAGNNASFLNSSVHLLPAAASSSPFSDPQVPREMAPNGGASAVPALAPTPGVAPAAAGGGLGGASPFGDSEGQGEVRVVVGTFDPKLEDELVLYPGDHIQVLMKYDDGWALGLNLSSGQHPPPKGCFPFDCLGQVVAPGTAPSVPNGASSASGPSGGGGGLPLPVPVALQPGTPIVSVSSPAQTQSELSAAATTAAAAAVTAPAVTKPVPAPLNLQQPQVGVDPASVPLPPPTPSSAAGDHAPTSPVALSHEAPQLAPLGLTAGSPLAAEFAHQQQQQQPPQQGGSRTANNVTGMKRASSLIASRDADLFVALGEVLDGQQQQNESRSLI